jgi:iron only hydrogenase large subunit-like protein
MIRRLGFHYVLEASFSVDIISKKYADVFKNNKGKYYFTSTCPVVTRLIEKFYPDPTGNLRPLVSPMISTAKIIHKKYGNDLKVVYMDPCIAGKKERYIRFM